MDYVTLGFAIILASAAVWYIFRPEHVKAVFKAPKTPFGQNPNWIIRIIGVMFAGIAIFLFIEVFRSN